MPTIFTHPAVPIAIAPWMRRVPRSLVGVAAVASAIPDADVAAFGFDIPYGHPLGHRGVTHSIVFALLFSAFAAFAYVRLAKNKTSFRLAFAFVVVAMLSHGVLDAMTNGGRGVGFFIPLSMRRFFFPFRPIEVSPIGAVSASVLASELRWVWIPSLILAAIGLISSRRSN